jgi:hypothetical protein
MKLNNLNFGIPLSKTEQKQIKGGEAPCAAGNFIPNCVCGNGVGTVCAPATGGTDTPYQACYQYCEAYYNTNGVSATACSPSCGGVDV